MRPSPYGVSSVVFVVLGILGSIIIFGFHQAHADITVPIPTECHNSCFTCGFSSNTIHPVTITAQSSDAVQVQSIAFEFPAFRTAWFVLDPGTPSSQTKMEGPILGGPWKTIFNGVGDGNDHTIVACIGSDISSPGNPRLFVQHTDTLRGPDGNPTTFNLTPDSDMDGVPDSSDNCINTPNPGQKDLDGDGPGDGTGDACDSSNMMIVDKTLTTDHSVIGDVIVQPGVTLTVLNPHSLTLNSVNLIVAGTVVVDGGTILVS